MIPGNGGRTSPGGRRGTGKYRVRDCRGGNGARAPVAGGF